MHQSFKLVWYIFHYQSTVEDPADPKRLETPPSHHYLETAAAEIKTAESCFHSLLCFKRDEWQVFYLITQKQSQSKLAFLQMYSISEGHQQ